MVDRQLSRAWPHDGGFQVTVVGLRRSHRPGHHGVAQQPSRPHHRGQALARSRYRAWPRWLLRGGRARRRRRRRESARVLGDLLLRRLELGDDRAQVILAAGAQELALDLALDGGERLSDALLLRLGRGPDDEVAGRLALSLEAGARI